MKETLSEPGVKIYSPTQMAEIVVEGLAEGATGEAVRDTVAEVGGIDAAEIRVVRESVGTRRDGSVWIKLPVSAAKKVVENPPVVG